VCTLAVAFRVDRRWPLVVAANRDERLGRPAEGWALRHGGQGPRHAAPRDLLAGGTWIGVSSRGLFAALTNAHVPGSAFPDPKRRSRGDLPGLALAQPTAAAARAAVAALDPARWNPFHLVVADAEQAFLWRCDGERAALEELAPGLHVVTEGSHEGAGPRGDVLRSRWPLDASPGRLRDLLSLHGEPARDFPCIHLDPVYGTRSAAILRLAASLAHSELFAADGPPCASPLQDHSRLLLDLARSA